MDCEDVAALFMLFRKMGGCDMRIAIANDVVKIYLLIGIVVVVLCSRRFQLTVLTL